MKQFYTNKKALYFSLLALGAFSFAKAQNCTAVQTFSENFDNFTAFPQNCWTGNQPTSPTMGLTTGTNIGIQLYSGFATGDIILVSPEVSTIDGQHLLSFDVISISQPGTTIEVGTMSDNTNFSTFSAVGTAFAPTAGSTHQTATIPSNTGHKYLAIKFIHGGGHKALVLDNIEWKSATAGTGKFDTSKVKIYPNPTNGIFTIDTEIEVKSIEVYNTLGQKILTTAQKNINMENAANGLYIVNVHATDGTSASYKIVKN